MADLQVNGTGTQDVLSSTGANRALNQELDRNAFMNLLLTQLQYQDPMKPMQDSEFIAQLAQFSALEQMQQVKAGLDNLNANFTQTSIVSLVGRTVTALGPYDETPITGKVTAISYTSGTPEIIIGEQTIDPAWVLRVE